MRIVSFIALVVLSTAVNAEACIGHIFVIDLAPNEGEPDAHADLAYYYHKIKDDLKSIGVSHSAHVELPIKSDTCFAKDVEISNSKPEFSFGYIFVRPDFNKKSVNSVLTGVDIHSVINEFFKK